MFGISSNENKGGLPGIVHSGSIPHSFALILFPQLHNLPVHVYGIARGNDALDCRAWLALCRATCVCMQTSSCFAETAAVLALNAEICSNVLRICGGCTHSAWRLGQSRASGSIDSTISYKCMCKLLTALRILFDSDFNFDNLY